MAVVHIESVAQFDEITKSTRYCVVDFSAKWCGPCKAIAPLYENLAGKHSLPGYLAFLEVDVDALGPIAERFGVRAMPTFHFLKEGEIVAVNGERDVRGANPPKLNAAVEKLFGLAQAKAAEESA